MKTERMRFAVIALALGACLPASKGVGDAATTDDGGTTLPSDTHGPTSTGEATGASEAATTTGAPVPTCDDDHAIGGGLWQCSEGRRHQRDPAVCEPAASEACTQPGPPPEVEYVGTPCEGDDDCAGSKWGDRCTQRHSADFGDFCECGRRVCTTTADCNADESCVCPDQGGSCLPANCTTDADCGDQLCALSEDACGRHGLFCTTTGDTCLGGAQGCIFVPENGHWEPGAIGCP